MVQNGGFETNDEWDYCDLLNELANVGSVC